ncbi:UNVERIFIED_CONTAM: hypothetical protein Slati_4479100 [Sesamum latifolium]|uniref:Gfo/Idh/MocA-like oxidoreductase C-terminal domain-containing protein n=1 Tax=Sesamum latifolium TaxID=2727402 RepID=A0AAW2SRU2_9LAMI
MADGVVKYGIVGVGMMGREHLVNLHHLRSEGVAVVAIADPHLPSQQEAGRIAHSFDWPLQPFETPSCVGGEASLYNCCRLQKVQLIVELLIYDGCNELDSSSLRSALFILMFQVVDAARSRPDILVQVGLEYRYMPPVAKLIEVIKGGNLGQIKMVAIREHRFPFLVKVNNWNRFNCNTGGTLVEKCCHFFDLMRLFAGADPVRVMASGAIDVNHKDETYDGKVPDIIDNAYVIVEFENGSRGMLDLCMFAEGSKNEQEISVVGDIGKGEAFVPESIVRWGTRVEGRDGVKTLKAKDDRIKYDGLHHGSSYLEHLQFLSAVRAKGAQAPAVDLHDGLISVAIGVAAQLSIEKGRFVTMEEVMK